MALGVPELVVALGPGEPALLPMSAAAALRAAGACALVDVSPELADAVRELGIELRGDAPVVAAPDARAAALVREFGCDSVPDGRLLARQAAAGSAAELLALTALLRRECPWDRVQTAASIVPHTIEEAYEVADAVQTEGLGPKLLDELGDLLFQTTFLALLLEERGEGDWGEVARGVTAKLRRRHPWVFGDDDVQDAGHARGRWEAVKREQEGRAGIFHDLPAVLPGLLFARKVQRRAAAVGFEYPDASGALADLLSELEELREATAGRTPPPAEHGGDGTVAHEAGDVLFAAVNVARMWNVDPELALRAAAARFRARVERAEAIAAADGVGFGEAELEAQERYYQRAKRALSVPCTPDPVPGIPPA